MGALTDLVKSLRQERSQDLSEGSVPNLSVSLTPVGENKAGEVNLPSPYFEVLNCINEQGPQTTLEISKKLRMPRGKVNSAVEWLRKAQYCKVAPGGPQ